MLMLLLHLWSFYDFKFMIFEIRNGKYKLKKCMEASACCYPYQLGFVCNTSEPETRQVSKMKNYSFREIYGALWGKVGRFCGLNKDFYFSVNKLP